MAKIKIAKQCTICLSYDNFKTDGKTFAKCGVCGFEWEEVKLSEKDAETLITLTQNPPEPNDVLKKLMNEKK